MGLAGLIRRLARGPAGLLRSGSAARRCLRGYPPRKIRPGRLRQANDLCSSIPSHPRVVMHESDDCKRLTIVLEIRDIMEYLAQNAPVVSALAAIVLGAERPQRQPYWLCLVHV